MNVRRVVSYGVIALALATWFAAASTSDVRPPGAPLPPPKPTALDRSAAALQSEISRLHERIGPSAVPAGSRDLFRFNQRAPRHQAATPAAPLSRAEVVVPAPAAIRPALKLIGIAEDALESGTARTAIVSGLGDVFLVKPGETIAGHNRVDQVSADAVQLIDTATSISTTLTLR